MVDSTINLEIWEILKTVPDPEVPVLSVLDLGVIRKVELELDSNVLITITPTYSGCPAMDMISVNIKAALQEKGYTAKIETILAPAWTTDWISEEGREKLRAYGIAPPEKNSDKNALLDLAERVVECPQCKSQNTKLVSAFGSTACKAMYKCNDCLEPFDYFKCY